MEIVKDLNQTQSKFKVVNNGNRVESINQAGNMFHYIDTNYVKDNILFHGWVGYRTNEQFKEVLDGHFMDLHAKNKFKLMVTEISQMTGTFSAVNDWMITELIPKLLKHGLQKHAVILPSNVFAQLSVNEWEQKVGSFVTRNFDSVDEAVAWLKS